MRKSQFAVGQCALAWLMFVALGCGKGDETVNVPTGGPEVPHPTHDHGHGAGPKGGLLIELGDKHEYHAEILFDGEARKTTLYIYGADARTPRPLDAGAVIELHLEGENEAEVKFTAQPFDGETDGKSSRFVADAQVPDAIKSVEQFEGHYHVTAGELSFSGEITHGDHDHDDHAHEEGDAPKPAP
ncbi:MAG: hypothetical protein WD066_10160 [Planctomycetaceae bacterium]